MTPHIVEVEHPQGLDDYATIAHLAPAVERLRTAASQVVARLQGRTLWMVNSTAKGGGVAEMLPALVRLLRDLGLRAEWAVIETDQSEFFLLTKRIHNLVHGSGEAYFDRADRELYESVNRANAEGFASHLKAGDIVVVHDPQPMPIAAMLRERVDITAVWRCHIGLDEENAQSRAAWEFLAPYAAAYAHAVFSASEYVPPFLADRSTIIHPGIDPLASKNRDMHVHELVRVLANSALVTTSGPVLRSPFVNLAKRLQPDGGFRPAIWPEDIGLLVRPIVTQVSRWDRLKGYMPLLRAFAELKRRARHNGDDFESMHHRRLEIARLVLAGPDPEGVADDPEATDVLKELEQAYLDLDPALQADVALVTLPMRAPRENALMVNALQRASSIAVQNSLREGFGLTVAEAMWKRIPVLSNSQACGPRYQVRDGIDGRLVTDPENIEALADALIDMLSDPDRNDAWGQRAQRNVHDQFLVFQQLRGWMEVLGGLTTRNVVTDSRDQKPMN
jgi:trehalose synthase